MNSSEGSPNACLKHNPDAHKPKKCLEKRRFAHCHSLGSESQQESESDQAREHHLEEQHLAKKSRREAQKSQRESESDHARERRLEKQRLAKKSRRESESDHARERRLEKRRLSEKSQRESESDHARERRLETRRLSEKSQRESESGHARERRLEKRRLSEKSQREAKKSQRESESDQAREHRLQKRREAARQRRLKSKQAQGRCLEERRDSQTISCQNMSATSPYAHIERQQLHCARLENALKKKRNLARYDDTDFFNESLHPDYRQRLSNTSLFECPKCKHCGALKWKEERNGFCCNNGKVDLSYPKPGSIPPKPPQAIIDLFLNHNFVKQARQFCNALAFTSTGVNIIHIEGYNPGIRIQGKFYHKISSPLPEQGSKPCFSQIYFHDPANELMNRCQHSSTSTLNTDLLKKAQEAIHQCNPYVEQFKTAIEIAKKDGANDLQIVLTDRTRRRDIHKGTMNLPSPDSDVAVIAPGTTITEQFGKLAVTLQLRGGGLQSIDAMHPAYDPLSYVLLLPCGSQGYHHGLKGVTPTDFYRYHLQVRDPENHFNLLLRGGRLTQQYVCDMFAKIESHRLKWVRNNQKTVKADKYKVIVDALNSDAEVIPGRLTILPPSIYGSPRWYAKEFQDAMALVRVKGKPDFFLTFTCNPKWPEITQSVFDSDKEQRSDIVARVFRMKVVSLLNDLLKQDILGHVDAYVMVKETQKRTLPHVHMLLTMVARDKPRTPKDIDYVISAEIPDKNTNPELHRIVTTNMIHGPCGLLNPHSPCMADRKCTKQYPKEPRENTSFSEDSFPLYRRRGQTAPGVPFMKTIHTRTNTQRDPQTTQKDTGRIDVQVDNRWVVPYNPYILLRYDAHINLEIVSSILSVKYLYKYIEKGPDQCMVKLQETGKEHLKHDEVTRYEMGRYITASEAYWRIYDFPIQSKMPAVKMLSIHLEDEQVVTFNDNDAAKNLLTSGPPASTLTAFFAAMTQHPNMRHVVYPNVFQHFTYNKNTFQLRKNTMSSRSGQMADTVGRLPMIALNPHTAELYYLRMLLYRTQGPTCFKDLRCVDGKVMDSYQAACIAHGIVEDDEEVDSVMKEAADVAFGHAVLEIFANMLMFVLQGQHLQFWERHKRLLCENFMPKARVNAPDESIVAEVLMDLKNRLERHGFTLTQFGIPEPDPHNIRPRIPLIIQHETQHNLADLEGQISDTEDLLNEDQRLVVTTVMESVEKGLGRMIAMDASGGTGKTFTLSHILNKVRAQGKVALATAASGIAATLLPKGTTFHSRTKCPLKLTQESTCNISEQDSTAALIRMTDLMVVDEVSMMDRRALEAADRTFRWLRGSNKPFGGITMLFSGDWRQILTVVPHGTRTDIVGRCAKSSELWKQVMTLRLSENMRIRQAGGQEEEDFAKFLLNLGEGKIPVAEDEGEFAIELDEELSLPGDSLKHVVDWVYEDLNTNRHDPKWLCERVILCPTNSEVDTVNEYMTKIFPGQEYTCYSVDTAESEGDHLLPTEYLNTLCPSGMPPHCMTLKKGMVIMLLRNFDQQNGHCNGSRYIIEQILPYVLVAQSVLGVNAGSTLLIPRITLSPSDNVFPFTLRRKQFPVRPCFAMTVNKSQGQSLHRVGIFCKRDFFSHGQFYVAASRVGRSNRLRILALDEETKKKRRYLSNVVYQEVLTK